MLHQTLFDDTKNSGWCVKEVPNDEEVSGYSTVYAAHMTCPRFKPGINPKEPEGARWSWFLDDAYDDDGIHVCFECSEPVPEHIQALVVLHTPIGDMP